MEKDNKYVILLTFHSYGRYLKDCDDGCVITTNNIFQAKMFDFPGDVYKYQKMHSVLQQYSIQVITVGE
jgi:hypothetical protein